MCEGEGHTFGRRHHGHQNTNPSIDDPSLPFVLFSGSLLSLCWGNRGECDRLERARICSWHAPRESNHPSSLSCSAWHPPLSRRQFSSRHRFPPPHPPPRLSKKKRMRLLSRLPVLFCCITFFSLPPQGPVKVLGFTGTYGINYGRIADNLPPPESVVTLLKAAKIKNVRIYDADHSVLQAFKGSGLELIVAIGNEYLKDMSVYEDRAISWVKENVQAFLPDTHIKGIAVGNEVLGGTELDLAEALLGAIKNVYNALKTLNLADEIEVSSPHSEAVFANSFPPSSCIFKEDVVVYMNPILDFFSQIGSPFYVNAYPFLAYKSDPEHIDIKYALFQPNSGIHDAKTGLHYDNMFDAQIDAAYAALQAAGYDNMEVRVSETGWASAGDENEAGATVANARIYNLNLRKRLFKKKGTPFRPKKVVKAYVFALFNEDLKPGPNSERHFGLFKADGSIAYNIGLTGLRPSSASSYLLSLKDLGKQSWLSPYSMVLTSCVAVIIAFTI